ncbi:MAG: hypothetical protein AAF614_07320 [Chloroflexota bacterium]
MLQPKRQQSKRPFTEQKQSIQPVRAVTQLWELFRENNGRLYFAASTPAPL